MNIHVRCLHLLHITSSSWDVAYSSKCLLPEGNRWGRPVYSVVTYFYHSKSFSLWLTDFAGTGVTLVCLYLAVP